MSPKEIEKYLTQSLNMSLNINGESSYSNSFTVCVEDEGFLFIPRVPASFIINDALYQKIFSIASAILYPKFTLLKQSGAYFVPLNTNDIHTERALYFPWKKGVSERLFINDFEDFPAKYNKSIIPIMKNLTLDFNDVTHVAIAGNSGSGKSYHLTYWLYILNSFSELIIIDPKFDSPSRWAVKKGIKVIHPSLNRSKNDFVSQVNESLSDCLKVIFQRQEVLFKNPSFKFKHLIIVIDELLALSTVTTKQIRDDFFGLLSQIALLGRSTNVHLIAVSQRFDANTLPVACREQFNVMIQLGNINKKTTQFLFPDLESSEGIVIPKGPGTGLIQIIDGRHEPNVIPLLTPNFKDKDGIFS